MGRHLYGVAIRLGLEITENQQKFLTDLLPHLRELYGQLHGFGPKHPTLRNVTLRIDGETETVQEISMEPTMSSDGLQVTVVRADGRTITIDPFVHIGDLDWLIIHNEIGSGSSTT